MLPSLIISCVTWWAFQSQHWLCLAQQEYTVLYVIFTLGTAPEVLEKLGVSHVKVTCRSTCIWVSATLMKECKSDKVGSHWVSNPGHLAWAVCALPLSHWATRAGQPPTLIILESTPGNCWLFTFLYFRLITSTFPVWGKMLWALIGSHFVFHTYYTHNFATS